MMSEPYRDFSRQTPDGNCQVAATAALSDCGAARKAPLAASVDDRKGKCLALLARAQADLDLVSTVGESAIQAVSRAFEKLAHEVRTILQLAAGIVGSVEKEKMSAVLGQVRTQCLTAKEFIGRRLDAAATIHGTLQTEEGLLWQLTLVTHRQEAIVRYLRALRVLTNIEVAHLGSAGANFQLLAQELSTFSKSLSEQTVELANDAGKHSRTIVQTRAELGAKLPELRDEVARMESDIEKTLRVIDRKQQQQATIPIQFQSSVEETSRQIAGVIAAIQAYDITRQQIEHVQQALQLIAARVAACAHLEGDEVVAVHAGLKLQICQLGNVKESVASWTAQIQECMQAVEHLSASEVVGIGPDVLHQEQELSSQLTQIELLQQKSGDCCRGMQSMLGKISNMMEVLNKHLDRSQAIRDRLQILMINSLIEAGRLGRRGAVVSSIANLIKQVSAEWNTLAEQSRLSLTELLELVQQTSGALDVFSESSLQKLRDDQFQTRHSLDMVRSTAEGVAIEAVEMQAVTESIHADVSAVADMGNRLQASFRNIDTALGAIEYLIRELEQDDLQSSGRCEPETTERWLSPFYTTEIERQVMSAALYGTSLAVTPQTFEGNAVELF
jgi:hypothetical protein